MLENLFTWYETNYSKVDQVKFVEDRLQKIWSDIPAGIYLLKINIKNTSTMCEICSKSTRETLEKGVKYIQS